MRDVDVVSSRVLHDSGEAEVEHLDLVIRRDFDVGRLQVAMNHALPMCRVERVDELTRNRHGFAETDRPAREPIGKRLALDQLEDERGDRRVDRRRTSSSP